MSISTAVRHFGIRSSAGSWLDRQGSGGPTELVKGVQPDSARIPAAGIDAITLVEHGGGTLKGPTRQVARSAFWQLNQKAVDVVHSRFCGDASGPGRASLPGTPPGQRREKAGDVVGGDCGRAHVQAIRLCRKALPRAQACAARAPPAWLHPSVVPQAAGQSHPD